ncbi:MAG: division/cell wall cluster transcriptional repressor MraZ [Flavobacteriales bacterium]|nr:division/cell wall cluster transcriptional repressor MraZ [Flavobacteriales bacterium]
MMNLIGTYECKADSKGRFMMPSSLKKQLSSVINGGFVLKRSVFNNCLELYPMNEWKLMVSQVDKLNRFVKKNNDFIRSYMSGLKMLEIDSTGRILIPKDLISFAGITKNLVLASSVNMIEIWDKLKYEEVVKKSLEDFGSLAEDVMGNQTHSDGLS